MDSTTVKLTLSFFYCDFQFKFSLCEEILDVNKSNNSFPTHEVTQASPHTSFVTAVFLNRDDVTTRECVSQRGRKTKDKSRCLVAAAATGKWVQMVNNVKVIPEYKTASAAALLKKKFKLKTTHTHTLMRTLWHLTNSHPHTQITLPSIVLWKTFQREAVTSYSAFTET